MTTRDSHAERKVLDHCQRRPGVYKVSDVAQATGVVTSTVSGVLRRAYQTDPAWTKIRQGHYRYQGGTAGPDVKQGDLLEVVTVLEDGRLLCRDQTGTAYFTATLRKL